MDTTKVIFRTDKEGITFALFPEEVADLEGHCMSYQHVGQHGSADYLHCIWSSRPATEEEYHGLMVELQRIGYDLEIRRRCSSQMRDVFNRQLVRLWAQDQDGKEVK